MAIKKKLIHDIKKKMLQIKSNKILKDIFANKGLQQDILDLNREDQLYERGIDAEGKELGDYSPITITHYKPLAARQGRDGRSDHVTLKDTGEFYRSFKFRNNPGDFNFTADAIKKGKGLPTDLTVAFGKNIIGLTDENKGKVKEWIRPDIFKAVGLIVKK